jgi:hypothetical protein
VVLGALILAPGACTRGAEGSGGGGHAAPAAPRPPAVVPERASAPPTAPRPPSGVAAAYRDLRAREARALARERPLAALALHAAGPLRDRLAATLAAAELAGASVAGGVVTVESVHVVRAGRRRATVRVVERASPWSIVASGALPPPAARVADDVVLRRVAGRWRVEARYASPWEPGRVQRPGEHWPALSHDGSVPPPRLHLRGDPATALRSIVRLLAWLHAHRPDPALLDACTSEHGPAREVLAARLRGLAAQGVRLGPRWRVEQVTRRDARGGAVDLVITVRAGPGALVDAHGRIIGVAPAWSGDLAVTLVADLGGHWRLADLFPADLSAWPDATNPLRIP